MLDTVKFIKNLISQGYTHICAVPCSFAKNVINSTINNGNMIEYLPCASEAVACSVAAGLKMSGKKPIVIVQSSGLPNMGSCITSLLIPYEIRFPIIVSWRTYEDGGSEIQHQHLANRLIDLIDAYGYSYSILDKNSLVQTMSQIKECENQNKICILEKNTFLKTNLNKEYQLNLSQYPKRSEYLKILNEKFKDTDTNFIGTTGNTAREMYTFMPDTNNFYMVGNMGGALSVGLGMAKAGKKVVVCGGDAEFVMHMGGVTTAGRYVKDISLTYILFDNESNKSTGGQSTYQEHVDYSKILESSGMVSDLDVITKLSDFKQHILNCIRGINPSSIIAKCSYDDETLRPPIKAIKKNNF
jgi:sulfopyruvate decarboxylase